MKRLVAGLMVATLLGGCQSIFGQRAKLEVRPAGPEQSPQRAAVALEEGKQYLRAGAIGSAIVALQTAATDPASAAEAHNGLGIAYATLGRGDLAERFFQQAVAENPAESKYSANLARYYQSREAALARLLAPTPVVVALAQEEANVDLASVEQQFDRVIQAGPGSVRVTAPTSSAAITRVSSQEVAIRTAPAAPVAADGRRRNPRYSVVDRTPQAAPYSVRLEFVTSGAN